MPKKSKRRAKAGGGSGGGGGGTSRSGADGAKPTAKNSDDIENNVQRAGILTTGAVRMFSECTKGRKYSVPKKAAPVLQIVSDLGKGGNIVKPYGRTPMNSQKCYLSDGARCIAACFSKLLSKSSNYTYQSITRHSVIRVPSYFVAGAGNTSGDAEEVLMVTRMELVRRNVGYVLGRTMPASCAVDGILTAGAVRMLLEREYLETASWQGAPVLQVMSDPVRYHQDGGDRFAAFELSDGRDWIKALITSNADMALPTSDLLVKHSIIRMVGTYMVAPGTLFQLPLEDRVLALEGVEVVATNVGRLIGNPTKVETSMPKKSKRRAKTGGSGGDGGGKVPGGGGGGADEAKKPTSDDEAGILTAGAVRMFSECVKGQRYSRGDHPWSSAPKNSAPVLQVVSDLEAGVDTLSWASQKCWLSDGGRCIAACFSSEHVSGVSYVGYPRLLATNQVVMPFVVSHSVIRIPEYCVVEGTNDSGGDEEVLMVMSMELVERDVGRILGRALPTSCPVENILTAGAIPMLLEKDYWKEISCAGTSAPTLQVVGDCTTYRDDGFDSYLLQLSDGKDWTTALIGSYADVVLPSVDLMIKYSIIRMDSCMVVPGAVFQLPSEDRVLVLKGVEVVARNVGRLIGNPAKAKKSGNPTRSSSPSRGVVRESWSYSKKLQVARQYFIEADRRFGGGSGDIGPALHHLSSYFQLPREQTEPFRAVMLIQWRIMLANWHIFANKRNGGKFTAETAATYDRFFANERSVGILKRLSSAEGGESVLVRAMATFIRGVTGFGYSFESGGSLSNALSYLRRFSVLVSECDLTELASAYDTVTCKSREPPGKFVIENTIRGCASFLSAYGGPSQRQVSSIFDLSPVLGHNLPFFLTIGGNFCDCCGKTPEEANLPVLFKCKTCRLAWYCSATCQAECWNNGHRDCCKKFGRFEKGDQVILEGLKKRPDLNGTMVSVEDLSLNGRASVHVRWPTAGSVQKGAILSIKKENLRHHRPLK